MVSINTNIVRSTLRHATVVLGTLSLALVIYGFSHDAPLGVLEGRLLPAHTQGRMEWVTVTADQVLSGTTLRPDTNVIIHIPEEITKITRQVLFARKGTTVRYWGYCFPHDLHAAAEKNKRGFPGDLFLSEAEREHRKAILETQRRRTFSVFENLTDKDLNESQPDPRSRIRHQLEIFKGGDTCYVMTEKPIPIGIDRDEDELNTAMERSYGTDDENPDTDGDGILDGLEVFRLASHPTKRDSDGDGIVDGIEDANRNGKFDIGETNPMEWDTDGDRLCDGICKVNKGLDLRGEDKNLNGVYDKDLLEYDPRTRDTDKDGVFDDHEVYLCVIGGGDDC